MSFMDSFTKARFRQSENGEETLFTVGIWAKPFIVPDESTRRKLETRSGIVMAILMAVVIIAVLLSQMVYEGFEDNNLAFLIFLGSAGLLGGILDRAVVHPILRNLPRAENRLYRSKRENIRLFTLSLAFTIGSVWLFLTTGNVAVGIAGTVLFGLGSVAFLYAFLNQEETQTRET